MKQMNFKSGVKGRGSDRCRRWEWRCGLWWGDAQDEVNQDRRRRVNWNTGWGRWNEDEEGQIDCEWGTRRWSNC